MKMQTIDKLAKKIWNYHNLNHKLEKADCILVLGSRDTRVAERGAQLFLEGWAPLIVFSGGLGRITRNRWKTSEAEEFAKIAKRMGVPKENVLIENKSSNTGENIIFTKKLLEQHGIDPQKFLVVQKPYMGRRTYATFKKIWPEKEIIVTSPQIAFDDYPNKEISKEEFINVMVGDVQRIKIYPEKGFQIPQEIPHDVWDAYEQLVKLGYNKHLINN